MGALLGALSIAGLAMTLSSGARAGEEVHVETLVDRLQIQDLITRYYNNFGRERAERFADFLRGRRRADPRRAPFQKVGTAFSNAYGRAPGQAPRPPPPPRFQFIVAVDNPLVVVHGKTGPPPHTSSTLST